MTKEEVRGCFSISNYLKSVNNLIKNLQTWCDQVASETISSCKRTIDEVRRSLDTRNLKPRKSKISNNSQFVYGDVNETDLSNKTVTLEKSFTMEKINNVDKHNILPTIKVGTPLRSQK